MAEVAVQVRRRAKNQLGGMTNLLKGRRDARGTKELSQTISMQKRWRLKDSTSSVGPHVAIFSIVNSPAIGMRLSKVPQISSLGYSNDAASREGPRLPYLLALCLSTA